MVARKKKNLLLTHLLVMGFPVETLAYISFLFSPSIGLTLLTSGVEILKSFDLNELYHIIKKCAKITVVRVEVQDHAAFAFSGKVCVNLFLMTVNVKMGTVTTQRLAVRLSM